MWLICYGSIALVTLGLMLLGFLLAKGALRPLVSAIVRPIRYTYRQWSARSTIQKYLQTHADRRLQIGTGPSNYPGWLNTDIVPAKGQAFLDASKRFPLPDRSFRYVYSEHVFEHLTYEDGFLMLRECHRILTPGGKLRIATPNLRRLVALFGQGQPSDVQAFIQDRVERLKTDGWPHTVSPACIILNVYMRGMGHLFVYDPDALRELFERAGFRDVREFALGESDDPHLRNIESRPSTEIRDVDAYETMVLQAVRL